MDKIQQMAQLQLATLSCPGCPNASTRLRGVCGQGNVNAKAMLVGQAPGAIDEQVGHPFAGPSGALLDQALAAVGLQRDQLWLTNVIKCRAVKRDKGRLVDRAPSAAEVRACRPWLEQELAIVQPRMVVCIGSPAAQVLIDKKLKIGEAHGRFQDGLDGRRYIAIVHPAHILRLRRLDAQAYERTWHALLDDLSKIAAALQAMH